MTTLYFEQQNYNIRLNKINDGKEAINALLDEFNSLAIPNVRITNKNLAELIKGGEDFVKGQIAESIETPFFGAFRMKKKDFVNTLELPGFTKLNKLALEAMDFVSLLGFYSLKNDRLIIDLAELNTLKETHSVIAKNPKQIKIAETHEQACKVLTDLNKALFELNLGLNTDCNLSRFFYYQDGEFKINGGYYSVNRQNFNK